MKIRIEGKVVRPLVERLQVEGDDITRPGEESQGVCSDRLPDGSDVTPTALSTWIIPDLMCESLDLAVESQHSDAIAVSKFFDGSSFTSQTLVSVPLRGLMCEGMGPDVVVGVGTRFIHSGSVLEHFVGTLLTNMLIELKFRGFFSIVFDSEGVVTRVQLGLPFDALYNVLEGVQSKLSDFLFSSSNPTLLESWTLGLLVSQWPFPLCETTGDKLFVTPPTADASRHIWWLDGVSTSAKSIHTMQTRVCVCTAWASTISEAARRVLRTARSVSFSTSGKVFRTDLGSTIAANFAAIQKLNLFDD